MRRPKTKAAKRIAKQKGEAPPPPVNDGPIDRPTPEQERRARFVYGPVKTEMGVQIGSAYHRHPLFETLAKTAKGIGRDELAAMRFYRTAHDRSEASPTKSCLNADFGGGGGNSDLPKTPITPSIIDGKRKVRACERALGIYMTTMRAVVLGDETFSEIAMQRYGSRKQEWIIVNEPVLLNGRPLMRDGKPVMRTFGGEKIVPRSNTHRQIISQEFYDGLRRLTTLVRALETSGSVEELWVQPEQDGSATIRRGACAPNGLFRMWGSGIKVGDVVITLRADAGDVLVYPDIPTAVDALKAAGEHELWSSEFDEEAAS